MKRQTVNLRDLVILVADPSSYLRMIVHSMLRGFGANKVLEASNSQTLLQVMTGQKVEILICDMRLPPHGGLAVTRAIRRNVSNENRTLPILMLSGDTSETAIKSARDVGANMVAAKPLSPKGLYDRLAWIAFNSRPFVDAGNYFGPDRRFKIEGYPNGIGRRKDDCVVEIAEAVGPALAQDDIDSLFTAARAGQS